MPKRKGSSDPLSAAIADAYRALARDGLILHAAGNVSARVKNGFLITPTGIAADHLTDEAIVMMDFNGKPQSGGLPSSEWRFHRDLYQARKDIGAIVHTHSRAATALACQRRSLPPFHYMIAMAGGADIKCADYALFGTQELSDAVCVALQNRKACLMANHGMIAVGADLAEALSLAAEVENLCELYQRACVYGPPVLLSESEIKAALVAFASYGQRGKRRAQ
jgi:L-fuculose-phosphate aldolase